jgi:hypothetical protein
MKVALCLSGQPRFIEHTFKNIKENLIDPNDADVFIHSWYDKSLVNKPFVNYNANGYSLENEHNKYIDNIDNTIINLYNPKKFIFENEKNIHDDTLNLDKYINTYLPHCQREYVVKMLYSSWYSVLKSNMLKEEFRLDNNIYYDFIIRARFDCQLNKPIICSEYDPNYLYTDYRPDLPRLNLIEDWFAFGSNYIMNIYSSAFNFIPYANIKSEEETYGILAGESLIYHALKCFNIQHMPLKDLIHSPFRPI